MMFNNPNERWRISGTCSRVTGHGENEQMLTVEKPGIPCPIYVGGYGVPPTVQRTIAEHLVHCLNMSDAFGHRPGAPFLKDGAS